MHIKGIYFRKLTCLKILLICLADLSTALIPSISFQAYLIKFDLPNDVALHNMSSVTVIACE